VNTLLQQSTMLAETRLTDIQSRYQSAAVADEGSAVGLVMVAMTVVVLAGLFYHFVLRKPAIENSPIGLLSELCHAHGLSTAGRRLLNEIAVAAAVPQPATIFLGQANFDAAFQTAEPKLKWDSKKRKTLSILRRNLFDA
jgi:hypothetical protein